MELSRRERRSTHLLAVLIGVLPPYALAVWMHLTRGRSLELTEMLLYPLLFGGGALVLILLLLRYLCGERMSGLNRHPAPWWRDLAEGLGLLVLFLALAVVGQVTIWRWFPPRHTGDMGNLLEGLAANPLLLVLWLGPVVWIGVAAFEEVSRVFVLTRLWKVWPGPAGRWVAVAMTVVLFALVHLYQGPAGIISTGLMGIAAAVYYLYRGRFWPLIISHALYDSAWIVFALVMMR